MQEKNTSTLHKKICQKCFEVSLLKIDRDLILIQMIPIMLDRKLRFYVDSSDTGHRSIAFQLVRRFFRQCALLLQKVSAATLAQ